MGVLKGPACSEQSERRWDGTSPSAERARRYNWLKRQDRKPSRNFKRVCQLASFLG